ncbi:cell division cycle-associated protein 7-like [Lineus longissimus]|uniref:cell division cycle-associated protein 7-like n=1 Tax=Lineus longissimus TaxID=88925 RepID=UPI002B4F28FC
MESLKKTYKLSEYELQRLKNIEDNKTMLSRLMEDLKNFNIPKPKPQKFQPTKRNPRRAPRYNPISRPVTRSRRGSISSANSTSEASTPEKLNKHLVVSFGFFKKRPSDAKADGDDWLEDEHEDEAVSRRPKRAAVDRTVKAAEEITEEDLKLVADTVGDKSYDSVYGTTCHQCRQKTHDMKTICRSEDCYGVRGQFCGPCLRNRYGEDARIALTDPKWECPPCRGICNCSFCRKKAGVRCTGILIHLAREKGYTDVNAYLQNLRRA